MTPLFSQRQLSCSIETVWGPRFAAAASAAAAAAAAGAPCWRLHLHAGLCGLVLGGQGFLRVVEGEREQQVLLQQGSVFSIPPLVPHLFAAAAATPLVLFVAYAPPLGLNAAAAASSSSSSSSSSGSGGGAAA
ncbi:hypothetical protein, conserved, partial [Eimeria tenella]